MDIILQDAAMVSRIRTNSMNGKVAIVIVDSIRWPINVADTWSWGASKV